MAHVTSREIAKMVRYMVTKEVTSRERIIEVTGLSERQLRRRLDAEVPFAAHHFMAIVLNPLTQVEESWRLVRQQKWQR